MSDLLATAIEHIQHLSDLDKTAKARFAALEIENVMVSLVDVVPASSLFFLAEQFDLLGYKGWVLADTEEKKRELIKRGIALHRYKGTPYSIREAFRSIGYLNARILEGVGNYYDNNETYNGAIDHGANNWAKFSVVVDLGSSQGVSSTIKTTMEALIEEYKNARSQLEELFFEASLQDQARVNDSDFVVNVNEL